MTTTTPNTVRRFDLPRMFAVFFNPRSAFAEIASETRSTWLTPMLVLSITAALVVIVAGYVRSHASMMGEVQLPPDWQYWTPDMQNNFMQAQQATQGTAFVYVIPFVGAMTTLWLGWVMLSGMTHLATTLLGGRGTMQGSFNVVAWACLPFAIRDILRIFYMMLAGHTIVSSGLSGFVAGAGFLSALLAHVDLFLVWVFVLLLFGVSSSEKLSTSKAALGVILVFIIALILRAGMGMAGSSLSGLGL